MLVDETRGLGRVEVLEHVELDDVVMRLAEVADAFVDHGLDDDGAGLVGGRGLVAPDVVLTLVLGGEEADVGIVLRRAMEVGDPPADDHVQPGHELADGAPVERRLDRRRHHEHRDVLRVLGRDLEPDSADDVVEVAEAEDRQRGARSVGTPGVCCLADVRDELIGTELVQLTLAQWLEVVVGHELASMWV